MINSLSSSFPLSINLKGKLISFNVPIIMGVLNITHDSFYKNSRVTTINELIKSTEKMLLSGATIIDIGAASSRPGAKLIDSEKEIEILMPALESLVKQFPEAYFSIDTYNSITAKQAFNSGAAMINDISAGKIDPNMLSTIASLNIPYVMMHMKGLPEHMQDNPSYTNVLQESIDYFVERVGLARSFGITDIIIDPGFGFGKLLEHNYLLLKNLALFEIFNVPILCGLSRKSMINKVIHTTPNEALNGTTVLNTIALLNGAQILRVHDAQEAKQTVDLVQYYQNVNSL
jgi:dihydropteroate synthase